MDHAERIRDPGLRWVYGPTGDWKNPEGPWHWAVYIPLDEKMVLRVHSFAPTKEACRLAVGEK